MYLKKKIKTFLYSWTSWLRSKTKSLKNFKGSWSSGGIYGRFVEEGSCKKKFYRL